MWGTGIIGAVVLLMVFSIGIAHAQSTDAYTGNQTTISDNLENDPIAQDLLKKIEQTKKMIDELQQKEYEQNQAQENLERARILSIKHLNRDLKEWERLWEQHSSRNAFDSFASKKPEHVRGVFWDQFEFKEQKVKAGRAAMNQILANGGTMQDAKEAYNTAASTHRIELIEVNAQFNVNHNLADYKEQQLFNSTGQVHFSPYTESKLSEFYSDHKLQPNYILANPDDASISAQSLAGSDGITQCEKGYVLVSRITSEDKTCVDETTAENWVSNNVSGIVIYNNDMGEISSDVKTNPATDCGVRHQVVYHMSQSEYQCVSDSAAKQMISNGTAEIHTLIEYIHNKDKQKITADNIYEINQKIIKINKDHFASKKSLESEYQEILENEDALIKQKIRQVIKEYKDSSNFTREDLSESISELNDAKDAIKEKIIEQRDADLLKLESEQKSKILDAVKDYEGNPDIKVDWNTYLDETPKKSDSKQETSAGATTSHVSYETGNNDFLFDNKVIRIDNVDVVNSFGQKLGNIESSQILQVVADITNPGDLKQNFVYMLDIKDNKDNPIRPTQWVTGTLTGDQTFNVGLSWIPEESGEFTATISTGNDMDSVSHVADIGIVVS